MIIAQIISTVKNSTTNQINHSAPAIIKKPPYPKFNHYDYKNKTDPLRWLHL